MVLSGCIVNKGEYKIPIKLHYWSNINACTKYLWNILEKSYYGINQM